MPKSNPSKPSTKRSRQTTRQPQHTPVKATNRPNMLRFEYWQTPALVHALKHLQAYYQELMTYQQQTNYFVDSDGELRFPDDYGAWAEHLQEEGTLPANGILLDAVDYLLTATLQSPNARAIWQDLRQVCYARMRGHVHLADWQWHALHRAANPNYRPPRLNLNHPLDPTPELAARLKAMYDQPNQPTHEKEAWRKAYIMCNTLLLQIAPLTPEPPSEFLQ